MDDIGFGRLIRMSRIRRGWRQVDLAARGGVTRTAVSRLERGKFGEMPLETVRAIADALDIRVEIQPRARAADLDRTLNGRHAALADYEVGWFARLPGWVVRPEVSFSEYGERGVIDLLCWHAASRTLLVVELKTELVDVNDLLGTVDAYVRLAPTIARRFGWNPAVVGSCLLIGDSMTNRRRVDEHSALLRSAFPDDGRALRRWLAQPAGPISALRFVSNVRVGHARSSFAGQLRVRLPTPAM